MHRERLNRRKEESPETRSRVAGNQPDVHPAMRLQRLIGNRATGQLLRSSSAIPPEIEEGIAQERSSGSAIEQPVRKRMEDAFGMDFSAVRVHGSARADALSQAINASAFTTGNSIFFRSGAFQPGTSKGQELLAHELTHVVQQTMSPTSPEPGISSPGDRFEQQAEATAKALTHANPESAREAAGAAASVAQPAPTIQKFDPQYHEEALIGGLSGVFTPSEIGAIYEANWQRDLSQAPAIIADAIIDWKQLKDQAKHRKPDQAMVKAFTASIRRLIAVKKPGDLITMETYSGNPTWSHMDNPGPEAAADADARWDTVGQAPGIPGYLRDARAYIKDCLTNAVSLGRLWQGMDDPDFQRRADDSWARETRPAHWDPDRPNEGRASQPATYGQMADVKNPNLSSSIIKSEVEEMARANRNRTSKAAPGFEPKGVAAKLMRDSHARGVADYLGRASHALEDFFAHSNFVPLAMGQKTVHPGDLRTGSFGTYDKLGHSLSEKLSGLVNEIKQHPEINPMTKLDMQALSVLAEGLEAIAQWKTTPESHTKMNMDNPEKMNFNVALEFATSSDHLVFSKIRQAMGEASPQKASQLVYEAFSLVDQIVNIPSASHPLKGLIDARNAEDNALMNSFLDAKKTFSNPQRPQLFCPPHH